MEYAGSYALFNYRLVDKSQSQSQSQSLVGPTTRSSSNNNNNLRLIRAFEHGLDPTSSEAGFVLVHVEMAMHSGRLVSGCLGVLEAAASFRRGEGEDGKDGDETEREARRDLNKALEEVHSALVAINASMETMWTRSKPREYTAFRTFIFGITSQPMFPDGVVYEGVDGSGHESDDDDENDNEKNKNEKRKKGLRFRGESGANDSIVPLVDNLVSIPMPDTPLTRILRDFRAYRPSNHRAFLEWVKERSEGLGLKGWALGIDDDDDTSNTDNSNNNNNNTHTTNNNDNDNDNPHSKESKAKEAKEAKGAKEESKEESEEQKKEKEEHAKIKETRITWLKILNQIRAFRWRHWCFAREYVLRQTKHPTATGGSPIVTWLPNQLGAVLDEMGGLYASFTSLDNHVSGDGNGNENANDLGEECRDIMDLVARQRETLRKEVARFCEERGEEN